jgi:hypothetical protein
MSDPDYKLYADRYFVTRQALDRRMTTTAKLMGETIGDILKPHLDRIAELERQVATLQSTLAGIRASAKVRP